MRTRWWVAIGAAVLLAGSIGGASLVNGGSSTSTPSLPRRIGAPAIYTSESPIGVAGVAFSSDQWALDGTIDTIALTAVNNDTYRRLPTQPGSVAGLTALLSPDGRRLAVENGIVDLATNAVTRLPPTGRSDFRDPQAWSADGRYLATVLTTQGSPTLPAGFTGTWTDEILRTQLEIVDTTTGTATRLADLDEVAMFDGWLAAFSPGNDRLAYQSGDEIDVVSLDGAPISHFTVPDGTRIAGEGAWTPDGRALALVTEEPCDCGGDYHARWTLTTVDPSSGTPLGSGYTVDGTVAIRMLGWSPAGEPVVVAYDPVAPDQMDPGAQPVDFRTHSVSGLDQTGVNLASLENLDMVAAARVLALRTGAPPRVLLRSTASGAESLDVARDVIAGGVGRAGDPPLFTEPAVMVATLLGVLMLLAGALATPIVLILRNRLRRRRTHPATA